MSERIDRVSLGDGSVVTVRKSDDFNANRLTIFCIHGLGDSSLAFRHLFDDPRVGRYNILVPDLAGYGDTEIPETIDLGFAAHVRRLAQILDRYPVTDFMVVGHSMGGVIGSLLVAGHLTGINDYDGFDIREFSGLDPATFLPAGLPMRLRFHGFINIEGNLTREDASISGRAVEAAEKDRFERWFEAFRETSSGGPWAEENPMVSHYGESLAKSRPKAFLRNSRDLMDWKKPAGKLGGAGCGELYRMLGVRRMYMYGTDSLPDKTLQFLKDARLDREGFPGAGHWLMNEAEDDFLEALARLTEAWK